MTSEDEQRISIHFIRHPRTSLRTAAFCLGLPWSAIQRVPIKWLHWFPYRLHIVQELGKRGYDALIEFFNWHVESIESESSFLDLVISPLECVFYAGGNVNKNNVRTWGSENLHETKFVPRQCENNRLVPSEN